MSGRPRPFDPREISGPDAPAADTEIAAALAAARSLESATAAVPVAEPRAELTDRIMAAIATEPAPRSIGILAALLDRPGPGSVVRSLRVAWTAGRRSGGPPLGRASALAYVAAVAVLAVSLSGVAAYGAAGAINGLLGPRDSQLPLTTPSPMPLGSPVVSPGESPEPGESVEPSKSAEPSGSVAPGGSLDDHGESLAPGASPGASVDDHGGGSGGSGTATPKPSETAGPTSGG